MKFLERILNAAKICEYFYFELKKEKKKLERKEKRKIAIVEFNKALSVRKNEFFTKKIFITT